MIFLFSRNYFVSSNSLASSFKKEGVRFCDFYYYDGRLFVYIHPANKGVIVSIDEIDIITYINTILEDKVPTFGWHKRVLKDSDFDRLASIKTSLLREQSINSII